MNIRLDCRETDLIANMKRLNIDVSVSALDVGDIQLLQNDKICIIIERKTVADYIASIKDKRLKNQIMRIKDIQKDNNCLIPILLIEGAFQPVFGCPQLNNQLTPVNIDIVFSSLVNKILEDQFYIIRSDDINQTCTWIKKFADKYNNGVAREIKYVDTISTSRKKNMTPQLCYVSQLCQVPGISSKIAQAIASHHISLFALMKAFQESTVPELTVANIVISDKKIGKIISTRLYQYLCGTAQ